MKKTFIYFLFACTLSYAADPNDWANFDDYNNSDNGWFDHDGNAINDENNGAIITDINTANNTTAAENNSEQVSTEEEQCIDKFLRVVISPDTLCNKVYDRKCFKQETIARYFDYVKKEGQAPAYALLKKILEGKKSDRHERIEALVDFDFAHGIYENKQKNIAMRLDEIEKLYNEQQSAKKIVIDEHLFNKKYSDCLDTIKKTAYCNAQNLKIYRDRLIKTALEHGKNLHT